MKRNVVVCTVICVMCAGCSGRTPYAPSRYDAIVSQNEYTRVDFALPEREYIGKTRTQIRNMMGEPSRVIVNYDDPARDEQWLYVPGGTNNFIAIILTFRDDVVIAAAYQSVI